MAASAVQGPAIGLIVVAGIGALLQVFSLLAQILGTGMSMMGDGPMGGMMGGAFGIVMSIVGLAVAGFIIWGALQMKGLKKHTISVAASAVAMVPCISPCCLLGLPVGIWAIIMLMKPEVKAAFSD